MNIFSSVVGLFVLFGYVRTQSHRPCIGYCDRTCYALFSKYDANTFLSSGKRSTPRECCHESYCEAQGNRCKTEQYRTYLVNNVAPSRGFSCPSGQVVAVDNWCYGHYRFSCTDICQAISIDRCMNGGTCVNNGSNFSCSCPQEFGGSICTYKCMPIDHCVVGHNTCHGPTYNENLCTLCESGYYSGGVGKGCLECPTVANCKTHTCSNGTYSQCMECNLNYWLIKNGTANQFCFNLKEIPHTECQGPCMIVYEVAVPWTLARDVCEARGGHLYVPESEAEEDRLRNYMEAVVGHIYGNLWFWIGGKLQPTDNIDWVGKAGRVDRWGFPIPHATTEPLCMGMDVSDSLLWNAYDCDQPAYFVCEERTLYNPFVVG